MKINNSLLTVGMTLVLAASCANAQAQKASLPQSTTTQATVTDLEVELMRKDLRDQKNQLVALNLPLTGDDAAKFWPLYDSYTLETVKINDERYALVKEYAANYSTLTDTQAASYIRRWNGVDEKTVQLRLSWLPKFEKAVGEKKAAIFAQIDRRLTLMIELQLSSELPLIAH